jgi:hypothetical protein
MEQIVEYSEDVIDRFIRSMGYDPRHIDRDKRMAFTKTIRFQQFARRMNAGDSTVREGLDEGMTYNKREMSKSARIIKSIYKKKRMLKDDMYDWEKDDKGGTSYGKKPKVGKNMLDGNEGDGAAAVMSGGKTLTGQKRDTVVIDPMIKKPRPGSPNGDNDSQTTK